MLQRDAIAIACTNGHPIGFDKKLWLRRRSNAENLLNIRGLPECNTKLELIMYEDYHNIIAKFMQQVVLA